MVRATCGLPSLLTPNEQSNRTRSPMCLVDSPTDCRPPSSAERWVGERQEQPDVHA